MSDPNQEFQTTPLQEFQPPPPPPTPPAEVKPPRPPRMLLVAIVLFVVGLALIGAGVAHLITGGTGGGVSVVLLSICLAAFSFIRLPAITPDAPPPMSLGERLAGIFYEPTRVFRNLRSYPRWLVAFLIIAVLYAAYSTAFVQRLTPDRIIGYTTEKVIESPLMPAAGIEQAKQNAQQEIQDARMPGKKVMSFLSSMVGVFFLTAFFAGLYLLGMLAFGGRMNFWQAFAVALYAALPTTIILKLLSFVLLYLKSPDDIHPILNADNLVQDNLGILFTPADHPVLFVVASFIGLTSFYKLWLTATGLRHGSYRASSGAAWGVALTLWIIGLVLSIALAAFFPGFLS
ncbi:MAG: YIP1 family protein [Pyrinomonadaceae bacterium]